ncbi:DUF5667 domain-containing protein [Chloroflexota bacterium]
MNKEFDNILNECIEKLLVQGEILEQALKDYPQQADELRPLLELVLSVREAASIEPRSEFKARARYEFRSALQETASQKSRHIFGWLPRWATAAAISLSILLAGSGTIAASGNNMPDDTFYPIKLITEQTQLVLTFSDESKAKLHAEFADRRINEIIYVANRGDVQKLEAITQRLGNRLAMLASLVSPGEMLSAEEAEESKPMALESSAPLMQSGTFESDRVSPANGNNKRGNLRNTIAQNAANHSAALRAALDRAPEPARAGLNRAINVTQIGYARAMRGWD